MKIDVRQAKKEDLDIILILNRKLFIKEQKEYDSRLNMDWTYGKDGRSYFNNCIKSDNSVIYIATVDGKIRGYLAGTIYSNISYRTINKLAEIENMFVDEDYRGQGVGRILIAEFKSWAKNNEAEKIRVITFSKNTEALKFYMSCGFEGYETTLEYEV